MQIRILPIRLLGLGVWTIGIRPAHISDLSSQGWLSGFRSGIRPVGLIDWNHSDLDLTDSSSRVEGFRFVWFGWELWLHSVSVSLGLVD